MRIQQEPAIVSDLACFDAERRFKRLEHGRAALGRTTRTCTDNDTVRIGRGVQPGQALYKRRYGGGRGFHGGGRGCLRGRRYAAAERLDFTQQCDEQLLSACFADGFIVREKLLELFLFKWFHGILRESPEKNPEQIY